MDIKVHLISQSKPIEYNNIKNAYTKDNMYCLYKDNGEVHKYPMVNIFRAHFNRLFDIVFSIGQIIQL